MKDYLYKRVFGYFDTAYGLHIQRHSDWLYDNFAKNTADDSTFSFDFYSHYLDDAANASNPSSYFNLWKTNVFDVYQA